MAKNKTDAIDGNGNPTEALEEIDVKGRSGEIKIKFPDLPNATMRATSKLCLLGLQDWHDLARISATPIQVAEAIDKALKADAKIDIPLRKQKVNITYSDATGGGGKPLHSAGATLKKLVVDNTREEDRRVYVEYTEPMTLALLQFHYKHRGANLAVVFEKMQPDLPEGNGEKDGEGEE